MARNETSCAISSGMFHCPFPALFTVSKPASLLPPYFFESLVTTGHFTFSGQFTWNCSASPRISHVGSGQAALPGAARNDVGHIDKHSNNTPDSHITLRRRGPPHFLPVNRKPITVAPILFFDIQIFSGGRRRRLALSHLLDAFTAVYFLFVSGTPRRRRPGITCSYRKKEKFDVTGTVAFAERPVCFVDFLKTRAYSFCLTFEIHI